MSDMRNHVLHCSRLVLAATTAVLILILAACAPKVPPPATVPSATVNSRDNLFSLREYASLTVTMSCLMTFDCYKTTFTWSSEFAVQDVPIDWMDRIYSGRLDKSSPGNDTTDLVHGSVSADGEWLDSAMFSRQVSRALQKTSTMYRVTLRNLPIASLVRDQCKFEKTGADLQKYVVKIEYLDGPLSGTQIVPNTTYLSTDWQNTTAGQTPALKLQFSKERLQPTSGKSGM